MDRPPIQRRRDARDQAAALGTVDQPAGARLVELEELRQAARLTDDAGATIEFPSVALRSANLHIQGSGQGAVSTEAYLAELPSLIEEIDAGTIAVNANPSPLADVEQTWAEADVPGQRTVLVP